MRRASLGILAAALGAAPLAAPGQIELSWSLRHNRTVLLEPVRAVVAIANNSGRTLDLSPRGNARLAFDVEDQPTSFVPGTGQPLLRQAVIVPANETREVEVNLLDGYRIRQGQTYMLRPVLETGGLRFTGQRLALEVQPGLELFQRKYGMPGADDAREVSLRLIHRDRGDRLFFRLDNPTAGLCLGVYELGRVIRYFAPRLERDRAGRFHVLHQSGPDRFTHSMFGFDGAPLETTIYIAEVGGIRLDRGEDGTVAVAGGTPFTEDPENPGRLTAPALPPAHPHSPTLGEAAPAAPSPAAPAARARPEPRKSDAGSESVSW